MGIADSILQAVAAETARRPGSHALRVGVRIGELAAIDPESLRFCFEVLVKETAHEGLRLEIERVPRRHRCRACEQEFTVRDFDFQCPRCRVWSPDFAGGDDLALTFLELDDGDDPAATESSERKR